MSAVEIEYCVPCGFLDRAQHVQSAILETYGERIDRVALVTGDSGVFRVSVDSEVLFDKAEEEFDVGAIVDRVGDRLPTAA